MPSEFRFEPRSLVLVLGQADTKYAHSTAHLQKHVFDPFVPPKRPIFKAFWDFPRAKTCHIGLERRYKQLFEHPKWSENMFFKKSHLFAPGTPVDPSLAPTVRGPGNSLAPPRWAILRVENHKRGTVAGGPGALGLYIGATYTIFGLGVKLTKMAHIPGHWPFFGCFSDISWG